MPARITRQLVRRATNEMRSAHAGSCDSPVYRDLGMVLDLRRQPRPKVTLRVSACSRPVLESVLHVCSAMSKNRRVRASIVRSPGRERLEQGISHIGR